jgi:hypothetical protein
MSNLRRTSFILAAFLAIVPGVHPQIKQPAYWEPIEPYRIEIDPSNPEVRALISRWNQIGEDLKTNNSLVAGTYEEQGYRGYFIRWSPRAGYVYVYHSEGQFIIGFSYGKVSKTLDEIVFEPEREMKESFDSVKLTMPTTWVPILSATGAYLIPKGRLSDFGNYVGGFGQYNDFNGPCCDYSPFFFMPKATTGHELPRAVIVPSKYESFIKAPIRSRIVYVGQKKRVKDYGLEGANYSQFFEKASLTPVKIDAGSRQGVRRNQLFRLINEPQYQYLKITSVHQNRADGIVIRDVDDDGRETYLDFVSGTSEPQRKPFPPIHVGTRITTSPILDY